MLILVTPPERHSPLEDAQGILIGTALVALSVHLLRTTDLMTGQIAGLSLVLSYVSGWRFGVLFFLLNLPFYILAFRRMGPAFTLKTFISVGLMSFFAEMLPQVMGFSTLSPAVAALMAGVTAGAGLLALFRHGASLGGVGIMALYLQDRTGFKAGWTQLIFDSGVFVLAAFLFPLPVVGYSLIGAVVVNVIIATNHRRDRYIAR